MIPDTVSSPRRVRFSVSTIRDVNEQRDRERAR